jgi:hypothetical protein
MASAVSGDPLDLDAIARAMEDVEVSLGGRDDAGDDMWLSGILDLEDRRSLARAIITSTDPAVLAALVGAGMLEPIEWEPVRP